MSFGALGPSTTSIVNDLKARISVAQRRLDDINAQVATGQRLLAFSDNTIDATNVLRLQRFMEQNVSFRKNIESGITRLTVTDNALADADAIAIDMREQIIAMKGDSASQEERSAIAPVVDAALDELIRIGNTTFLENFIFAGHETGTAPFERIGSSQVLFNGDENTLRARVGANDSINTLISGSEAFGALTTRIQGTVDLNPQVSFGIGGQDGISPDATYTTTTFASPDLIGLTSGSLVGLEVYVSSGVNAGENGTISAFDGITGTVTIDGADAFSSSFDATSVLSITTARPATPLNELNEGRGVSAGSIQVTYGATPTITTVDLSDARDLQDIQQRIEGIASTFSVSINASGGLTVTESSGNPLTIASVGSVQTAEDLGINGTGAGGTITGSDVEPVLTGEVLVSDLDGGSGLTLGNLVITNEPQGTATIDLSTATTIDDVLFAINNATTATNLNLYVDARINDDKTGIDIVSRLNGANLSITNDSGGTTATDLGLLNYRSTDQLSDLNFGQGINSDGQTNNTSLDGDFYIEDVGSGTRYHVDVDGASTVADIISRINTATGGVVTASFTNDGSNGMVLTGTGAFNVVNNLSNAATDLGIAGSSDASFVLTGSDVNKVRTDSIFTALGLFHTGLTANDTDMIHEAGEVLEVGFDTLLDERGRVGGRITALELTRNRLENEHLRMTEEHGELFEVDLALAVVDLQRQNVSFQALLQATTIQLQNSLLNFL